MLSRSSRRASDCGTVSSCSSRARGLTLAHEKHEGVHAMRSLSLSSRVLLHLVSTPESIDASEVFSITATANAAGFWLHYGNKQSG